ncbi:MAG: acetyl-CoA hydrolase/transferase family protein [Acidimicrobiia bacterium]
MQDVTVETLRRDPTDVLEHVPDGADVIVPLAVGEPPRLLATLDEYSHRLRNVRVHQMHAMADLPYLHGAAGDNLRHVGYFLSPTSRRAFAEGGCDMVPANFSDMPKLLRDTTKCSLVIARCAPPDRHGYFSLGTNADYTARFIGKVPFFLEVNPNMPRTFGENNIHASQVSGWIEADDPIPEVAPAVPGPADHAIAALIAERVPDGATVQVGIGAIPNAVLGALKGHRNLGLHTELMSDGVMDLFEAGVITGVNKTLRPGKMVTTFAMGTKRFYEFIDENAAIEFLPVDWVNDPRTIGREPNFVSINATVEVDFLGQCNSEMIDGQMFSGSGGQFDFARGAMHSENGQGFIAVHSTARSDTVSRVVPRLSPGAAVTTMKNTVDKVVTEFGVAELRGRTLSERARALIDIAHPKFRDELEREAHAMGYLHQ